MIAALSENDTNDCFDVSHCTTGTVVPVTAWMPKERRSRPRLV